MHAPRSSATPDPDKSPDRRHPDRQALRADGRRLLPLEEVAQHLDTTVKVVRKLIHAGQLTAVRLSPRNTRVPERSVVAFLDR